MSGLFARLRTLNKIRQVQGIPGSMGLHDLVLRDIIPFVAGAVIAKMLEYLITLPAEDKSSEYLRIILVIATVLTFIVLILILRISALTTVLQSSRAHNVFLHRDRYINGQIKKAAFSFCTEVCLKAKKSIIVMGPHFEKAVDSAPKPGTESHDSYLEEGMAAAIERHVHDDNSDFRYERIVQLGVENFRYTREKREFGADVFNNQTTAEHVKKMLKKAREAHTAEITMYARPYIPSCPSILVVDDRYVFFSLPTGLIAQAKEDSKTAKDGDPDQDKDLTNDELNEYKYDMVLGIEDLTGEIPTLFRQVILQFKKGGCEIAKVLMSAPKNYE